MDKCHAKCHHKKPRFSELLEGEKGGGWLPLPPLEDPSLKNSHFPCLVAGASQHFERNVLMVFIDPQCPASSNPPHTPPPSLKQHLQML